MKFQFTIDGDAGADAIATDLMMSAAHVFKERFPDRWEEAMALLASKIALHVRVQSGDGVPSGPPSLKSGSDE